MSAIQEIFSQPKRQDRRSVNLLRCVCPALVREITRTRDAFEAAELLGELTGIVNRANLPDFLRFQLMSWLLGISGLNNQTFPSRREWKPRQVDLPWAV